MCIVRWVDLWVVKICNVLILVVCGVLVLFDEFCGEEDWLDVFEFLIDGLFVKVGF